MTSLMTASADTAPQGGSLQGGSILKSSPPKAYPLAMKRAMKLAMKLGGDSAGHTTTTTTSIARGLHTLLLIVMTVLAITCAGLFIIGVFMLFPNSIRDGIFSELQVKGLEPKGSLVAFTCFAFAIMSGAYMAVIVILRKIVKTLMQGDPFVPENISRLRIMWIILAVSEIFRMAIHLMGTNGEDGMINIRLGAWFMVFVIAALSEVFRHGAELRRDQELTV